MARVAKGHTGTLAVAFTTKAAPHRYIPETQRPDRRAQPREHQQQREDNAPHLSAR